MCILEQSSYDCKYITNPQPSVLSSLTISWPGQGRTAGGGFGRYPDALDE